jgi:hypothetical protein
VTRFIFKIMSLFFFVGELRRDGVLRNSHSPSPLLFSSRVLLCQENG